MFDEAAHVVTARVGLVDRRPDLDDERLHQSLLGRQVAAVSGDIAFDRLVWTVDRNHVGRRWRRPCRNDHQPPSREQDHALTRHVEGSDQPELRERVRLEVEDQHGRVRC